jgi:hypothetical protein
VESSQNVATVQSLSPTDFGTIIRSINFYDQARAAETHLMHLNSDLHMKHTQTLTHDQHAWVMIFSFSRFFFPVLAEPSLQIFTRTVSFMKPNNSLTHRPKKPSES